MGVESYTKGGKTVWCIDSWITMPDGSAHRLRKRDIPTRELALALLNKAKAEAFEGRWFARKRAKRITVAAAWKAYEPVTRRRNKSWKTDTGRAVHLTRHLGRKQVSLLTRRDVDRYIDVRLDERSERTKRTPSVAQVNRELSLLRRVINYSAECGDVRANPLAGIRLLRERNVRRVVLGEVEYEGLRAAAEEPLKPILDMGYYHGMRKTEVLRLRKSQLDLKAGVIRLEAEDTKTGEPRLIHLSERTVPLLEAACRNPTAFVFVNPKTNKPWSDVRKMFKRACKAAGLNGIWYHDLRRSFVTAARRRGIPESVVMRMSGHRTREVFMRYNIIDEVDLKRARERFEEGRREELAEEGVVELGTG